MAFAMGCRCAWMRRCWAVLALSTAAGTLFAGAGAAAPEAVVDGVQELDLRQGDGLPVDTMVLYPQAVQDEPLAVVVMTHGFLLSQHFYKDVLTRVAAAGFVVVAPQTHAAGGLPFGKPTTIVEAKTTAAVVAWASAKLARTIQRAVDFDKLGLIDHSRGGKVDWILLRDHLVNAKAVAAIDPIDGTRDGSPAVLAADAQLTIPALVIGSGLGPKSSAGGDLFACAPADIGYHGFWTSATQSPSWMFVAKDFGHADFLDDGNSCGLTCSICVTAAQNRSKADLRAWVGTTIGAFLRGVIYNDARALDSVGQNPGQLVLDKETR